MRQTLKKINYGNGYLWVDVDKVRIAGCKYLGQGFNGLNVFTWHDEQKKQFPNHKGVIVAQTNLYLPNIPYVEVGEEDVEALAEKVYPPTGQSVGNINRERRIGFTEGYKTAQAKGKYSDEDMEAAVCFGIVLNQFKYDEGKLSDTEEFKGFLQSLNLSLIHI